MKKRGLSVLLLFCMLLTMVPPALATGEAGSTVPTAPTEERIIYVSEEGTGNSDGATKESATTLAHATELANVQSGPVRIVVVGKLTVDTWETPTVDATLVGTDDTSQLNFKYRSAVTSDATANISLNGKLTIDNLKFDLILQKGSDQYFPDTGTFTIVANGHELKIGSGVQYVYPANGENNTNVSRCHVIGGSLGKDLDHSTHVEIYAALPNCYVVGGCVSGNLTGNTYVHLENSTVQRVMGGGATWVQDKDANVTGNTEVIVKSTDVKNWIIGGGHTGDFNYGNANVTGNTSVRFENTKSASVKVYGGGMAGGEGVTATVGGNVTIYSKFNNMSSNGGTVYGGGYASKDNMDNAKVNGDITIEVADGYSFGTVYGGGHYANVGGNIKIKVSGTNDKESPSIYGGGEGYNDSNKVKVTGTVDITLNGVRSSVATLGKFGTVDGKTTVHLKSGGGKVNDTIFRENILNADAQYINWAGNITGNPEYYKNAEVIVSDGTFVATTLYGFPKVTIQNGGTLQEQLKKQSQNNKTLFKDTGDVSIESGGTLSLLQTNEISGTFNCAGTLTMPQSAELIAGGKVTVSDGAMFVPTDGYKMGDVFLKSKTAFTQDTQPEFAVNRKGETDGYFTANRAISDGQSEVKNEWYVSQLFTLKPLELTKYIAGGEHNHDDPAASNCFPDPRFVGLDEDAEIKVNGNVWNKSEHHGQYPFVINYYDKDGTLLEDDHKPGTYVAKVEPSDGIKLTNITINGCKIKTEDSLLHIRNVSDVAGIENIDQFASAIQSGEPTGAVKDATAVIPDSTNYLVNNLAGQIPNADADIRLLHDELLSAAAGEDPFMKVLQQRLEGTLEGATTSDVKVEADPNRQYAMKYLDLIDANDSNLLVCAQGAYDIYLPYPAGTDQNTEFALYRFDDLNRTYTQADSGEGALDNIKKTSIRKVEVTNEKAGIKFTVPADFASEKNYSIGAMALTWVKESSGGGVTTRYTLSHDSNGGTQYKDERYVRNTVVQLDKVPTREGYTFTGWYADKELTQAITEIKMTSNKTVYAGWEETDVPGMLNGEDHYAYVVGYEDGTVRPGGNISRAEVATIFFRLLQDQVRQENLTTENVFSDVSAGDWYNTAISTMAELGILKGRTPDTFVPNAPITRAEFAAICARFDTGENADGATFPDLAGHWAKEEVERAVSLGWIMGYEDNTFRPDKAITRAEAVTMINRVLQRNPQSPEDLLKDMVTWPDNQDPSQWYYLAIQEATNSHDYERTTGIYETWTQLRETPDWSQYE